MILARCRISRLIAPTLKSTNCTTIVRLKSGESAGFRYIKDNEGHDYPGAMHTSCVVDYYISSDKKNVIVQTENTIYKFEKIEED